MHLCCGYPDSTVLHCTVLYYTVLQAVHLCCGYPDRLDTDVFPKAPKTNYNLLAPKLDSLGFDEVSIEDAEAMNDLSLLALFKNTKVVPHPPHYH